jgi:hypothetical protein
MICGVPTGEWKPRTAGRKKRKKENGKMTIEISDDKADAIVRWLGRMFDKVNKACDEAKSPGDVRKVARLDGEYGGAREALAAVGIRVRFDRHTRRPAGIEKWED